MHRPVLGGAWNTPKGSGAEKGIRRGYLADWKEFVREWWKSRYKWLPSPRNPCKNCRVAINPGWTWAKVVQYRIWVSFFPRSAVYFPLNPLCF